MFGDSGHGYDFIVFAHLHDGNALGGASHGGDVGHFDADDDAMCFLLYILLLLPSECNRSALSYSTLLDRSMVSFLL